MSAKPMNAAAWGLLVALSALWGGSFFFAKVAVAALPPLTVVWLRVAIAAAALAAFSNAFSARGTPPPWRQCVAMGLLNNVIPFTLMFWAQTRIASGLAAILNATTPLFGLLIAQVMTDDERLTRRRLAGVLIGIAGVATLIGLDALRGDADVVAQFAVLAGACSYGFAGIYGRRFREMSPLATATGQLTAASLLLLPVIAAVDRPWQLPTPPIEVVGALAGLALLSTALGYVLYFRILTIAGATNLLLVTLLIPVSALLLGTIVLGERLALSQVAGMALIGAGLAVIDGRLIGFVRRRTIAA